MNLDQYIKDNFTGNMPFYSLGSLNVKYNYNNALVGIYNGTDFITSVNRYDSNSVPILNDLLTKYSAQ